MLVKCRSLGSVAFGVSCAITFPYGRRFQGGLGAENLLDQVGMIGVEFAPETGGERWTNLGPAVNR